MVIRVLVATEVRLYRDGLQRVLQGAEGIALVGIAATAEQVVEQACKLLPSVILLDIAMAKRLALCRQFGGTPRPCGIVLLGTPEMYSDVAACLRAEILAFVAREATVTDLLSALRAAGRGEGVAQHAVVAAPMPLPLPRLCAIDQLTEREMEILRLMQKGLPNKEISRRLGIELSTVKNHVHSILAKLGVHNRGEAISWLYRHEHAERAREADAVILPIEQPAIA